MGTSKLTHEQDERHATVVPEVEVLTDRIMNWYGFTYPDQYVFRPWAMLAACDLYAAGVRADSLTHVQIQEADTRSGGKLQAMFRAMHPVR